MPWPPNPAKRISCRIALLPKRCRHRRVSRPLDIHEVTAHDGLLLPEVNPSLGEVCVVVDDALLLVETHLVQPLAPAVAAGRGGGAGGQHPDEGEPPSS